MAMELYTKTVKPLRLCDVDAAGIPSNYMKVGYDVGDDAAEAGGTDTILVATAHAVSAGDFLMFYDGDEESEGRDVASVGTDLITLSEALSGTPSSGENFVFLTPDGTDLAEAAGTSSTINATGHSVTAGDLLFFTAGGEINEPREVASVNANDITLSAALSGAPSAGEAFSFASPRVLDAAVEAGTTDTIITDADHTAVVGDLFVMTSGGEINEFRVVIAADATTFTLNEALSGTPSAAETYSLWSTSSDTIEAGASSSRLIATAHAAQVGDYVVMQAGGEDGESREVTAVGTDYIDLGTALSGAPSASEAFSINRPVTPKKVRALFIDNTSNQPLRFSVDGTTDHFRVGNATTLYLDFCANNLRLGTQQVTVVGTDLDPNQYLWVKVESTAPTSGGCYITFFE